jgi:ribosome biogenesis GTPase / thiamine phosphate phosphatase
MTRSWPTEMTGLSQVRELWGTVLAVQANYYQVYLPALALNPTQDDRAGSPVLLCTRRSRLKKIGQRVLVGDHVRVEDPDWQGGRGAIAEVRPRHTELNRPPIANVDQILLVFAIAEPSLDPYQLSRFLVMAEMTGLPVQLCLSKADLASPSDCITWEKRLHEWGYTPWVISVYEQRGLTDLHVALAQKMTVITGPSGVGKSSLINALIPNLDLRVGDVSAKLKHGRHTTRHVELFELNQDSFLADTPGFNLPDLDRCTPEQLNACFPEILARQAHRSCQFSDCRHRDEPNCAVGRDWDRYPHYLDFLTIVEQQSGYPDTSEPALKLKTKSAGREAYEPRLAQKKYRRSSRRSQQQALQALYPDLLSPCSLKTFD